MSREHLKRHERSIHPEDGADPSVKVSFTNFFCFYYFSKCNLCGQAFHKKTQRRQHMLTEHPGCKPYPCQDCHLTFQTPSHLRTHRYQRHSPVPKLVLAPPEGTDSTHCPTVEITGSTLASTVEANGAQEVPPTQFPCSCGRIFKSNKGLKHHMHMKHSATSIAVCELCDKKFSSHNALRIHHDMIHLGLRPFVCGQCGYAFKTKGSLKRHRLKIHCEADFNEPEGKVNSKPEEEQVSFADRLLGREYEDRLEKFKEVSKLEDKKQKLECPVPECPHFFVRVYDLVRHLKSEKFHGPLVDLPAEHDLLNDDESANKESSSDQMLTPETKVEVLIAPEPTVEAGDLPTSEEPNEITLMPEESSELLLTPDASCFDEESEEMYSEYELSVEDEDELVSNDSLTCHSVELDVGDY